MSTELQKIEFKMKAADTERQTKAAAAKEKKVEVDDLQKQVAMCFSFGFFTYCRLMSIDVRF